MMMKAEKQDRLAIQQLMKFEAFSFCLADHDIDWSGT